MKAIYKNKTEWLVPAGLIVLSIVPVIAGTARLAELSGGAEITPENARFFASPWPVLLHIFSFIPYSILGAFQFVPHLRQRGNRWHRLAGRFLVLCGLLTALSGLWMTLFYPWPQGDGELLYGIRLVVGAAMLLSLILGVTAIRRRDIGQHRAWMIRAYAIGMGAGTQVFTHLPWFILFGTPDEFPRALLMGAGWAINIVVAEWLIHKRLARPTRTSPVAVPVQ